MTPPRRSVNLSALDLAHLRVLDTMLVERSVRKTAERLGLTSSAISHALGRLRHELGDELFIRKTGGMHPTRRAMEIAPRLRESLNLLQCALDPLEFNPALSHRSFTIACLPFVVHSLIPEISRRIRKEAPNIMLRVGLLNADLAKHLDSGRVDLAIGAFGRMPAGFSRVPLMKESMVFVVRTGHPLVGSSISLRKLSELTHIDIEIDESSMNSQNSYRVRDGLEYLIMPDDRQILRSAFERAGLSRKVGMIVPDTLAALFAVSKTDMIALTASTAARDFALAYPITLLKPPYPAPALNLELVLHKRKEVDPGIIWLQQLIASVCGEMIRRSRR